MAGANLPARRHAVALLQADVEHSDVGVEGGDAADGLVLRTRLADDHDVVLGLEQVAQPAAHDLVVVEEEDRDPLGHRPIFAAWLPNGRLIVPHPPVGPSWWSWRCEMRDADRNGANTQDATTRLLAPFARDVLLATGRPVRVRPARADDFAALERFYRELSETSSYFRFFGVRSVIPEAELRRATEQDASDHVTLVVDANGELIAIGEYYARPGGEEAEVAFAVADAHHQEGIATVLVEDLAGIAREAGFRRLVAQTLPDNVGMQRVFRDVGLVHRSWFEDGAVHVHLDLTADDLLQDHADLRDWAGAVRSLQPILHPRHVVVVGGGDATSPGGRILSHLRGSFDGTVSVVDPPAGQVGDLQLDGVPDLAIVAVPATMVAEVVEQCGVAGVRTAVVVTAGFAETGSAGAALQADVLAAARRHGMRLVGPDSLGIVATSVWAQRNVHQPAIPSRWYRHRLAVRRCRDRHRGRGGTARRRRLLVRLDGQQSRRQRQRPVAAVGRGQRHEGDAAVPRIVRRSGALRPHRQSGVATQARRRPEGRQVDVRVRWRAIARCRRRRVTSALSTHCSPTPE